MFHNQKAGELANIYTYMDDRKNARKKKLYNERE
jgi:hypothetical protein